MSRDSQEKDVAFIRAIAEVLQENDLTEVEVKRDYGENDTLNVRVSRTPPAQVMAAPVQMPVAAAPAPVAARAPEPAVVEDPALLPGAVTSPMVGTVYLSPEPEAAAFVSVGDTVSAGQTLLIIEAMKTMNQIPAPQSGTIRRILVENGAPVEFGAPLMIID